MPAESFFLNKNAVKRIMELQGFTQVSLAEHLGKTPSEISLWVNCKRKITSVTAIDLAKTLGCTIRHLKGQELFHKFKDTEDVPIPGTPQFYTRAIEGKWLSTSHIAAHKDFHGNDIPAATFEWELDLTSDGNLAAGTCLCRTPGFEHARFALKGEITGRGVIFVDGNRDVPDGSEDYFRGIFQYYSDGKNHQIYGGYVLFWSIYQHIIEGHAILRRPSTQPT